MKKGTVLYLALEDDYRRLQERMYRMFGTDSTENLYFSVSSKYLGKGLTEQLTCFIKEHPDTTLVIIDTLQKIREADGDSSYSYAKDYEIINQLKQFSDSQGICLLLVHHKRKQKSTDSFDMISGTNGLLGCADGAFMLYKPLKKWGYGKGANAINRWRLAEWEALHQICKAHGIEISEPKKSRRYTAIPHRSTASIRIESGSLKKKKLRSLLKKKKPTQNLKRQIKSASN